MAVQAEYPSDMLLLPETSWSRMRNLNGEEKSFIQAAFLDDAAPDFKMLPLGSPPSGICNQILSTNQLQSSMHGNGIHAASCEAFHVAAFPELSTPNMWICNNNSAQARKRMREADKLAHFVSVDGAIANSINMPPQTNAVAAVSTGLRLSNIEDDLAISTSGREFSNSNINNSLHKNFAGNAFCINSSNKLIAAELQRQRGDIEQFLKQQEERVRQILLEKTEKHSKTLICAAAAAVSRKLREKEMQVMAMKRRNMQLEDQLRGLTIESLMWQNRANNSEALANALRLQIDHNKEGSGDSEEEAMGSCQINTKMDILMEKRELETQRICRVCRSKEVCILVLPCRHLCLCNTCESKTDVCPICKAFKSASVQVYMS